MTQESLVLQSALGQQSEPTQTDLLAVRFQLSATTLSALVIALGVAGAAAWLLDTPALASLLPGFAPMTFNAAIALLATGVSIWLYRAPVSSPWMVPVIKIGSGIAMALAVLMTVEYTFGWNLDLGRLLHTPSAAPPRGAGKALVTAVCLLCINGAVLMATLTPLYGWAQGLIAGAVLLTTLSTVGYFFGSQNAMGSSPSSLATMAVPMAAGTLFASLGFLFARPREGVMDAVVDAGSGGLAIRQLLPVVLLLPLVLSWLTWQGVKAGLYHETFAYVLFVSLTINALSYAIWAGGQLLRRFEDRRLAAEAGRNLSEDRLRRAVSDAPVPMVIHEGDQILHMSRGWSSVSGFAATDTPTMSKWLTEVKPGHDGDARQYLGRLATLGNTASMGEQTIQTRGGETRVWDLSTTPLGGHSGGDRVFVTMATDVTERKRAESDLRRMNDSLEQRIAERTGELTRVNDALKRQSDQLREQATLLDLVRDGILVRDLYGTIVYWSAGAKEMYGFDRSQALGTLSHKLLGAEYPQPLAEIEALVVRDGFWEGQVVHVTKDGYRLFIESRWTLTRTDRGAPEGFLEVNRDITARKHAQDSLADSEMRFRAVSETAIEGIIAMDESGVISYWNPGADRLFGRPATEMVGLPMSVVMVEPFLTPHLTYADEPAVGRTFETIGRRADGAEFPIEISLSAWSNTQGDKLVTAIVRDITERKDAELALEAKAEELARSNQELEQFAYVTSHDLQEPLRMVANYTQLLGRRYKDKLDADANEFIDFAVDGAKRMQELIHDLLAYARVGTRGKEFKPTAAASIVSDAVANLSTAIEESGAEVVIDTLPSITCDRSQLAQVFQNLIGNAVKFARPGQHPVVHISAAHSEAAWEFTVEDNGIGIEPKYFDRIFQMFQRLHTRQEYPGTGIGLALCKKIVERHAGHMRVDSTPGHGTRFSFTIPDAADARREER